MCQFGLGSSKNLTSSQKQTIEKGGKFIVDYINDEILKDLIPKVCHKYELGTIVNSHYVKADRVSIIFTTKPNNASFEADIQLLGSDKFKIIENKIDRITLYGKTADCIKNEELKNFCYCV